MVTVISATEAKQRFAALLDAAQRGPVRIQRYERDVAVLVSPEDYEALRKVRAKELIRLSDEMGRYAASQGMTDELLQSLLAEDAQTETGTGSNHESVQAALARGQQIRDEEERLRSATSPAEYRSLREQRLEIFNQLIEKDGLNSRAAASFGSSHPESLIER